MASVNAGDLRHAGSIPGQEDPLEKEMATHSSILARYTQGHPGDKFHCFPENERLELDNLKGPLGF